jgi:hypothetical protein
MSTERIQRLDKINFVWDPLTEAWEEGFNKLLRFKELEGHCRVSSKFKFEGFNLGAWLDRQRQTKDNLSPERKHRLGDLGVVWILRKDKT